MGHGPRTTKRQEHGRTGRQPHPLFFLDLASHHTLRLLMMMGGRDGEDDLVPYPTWLREAEIGARDRRRTIAGESVNTDESVGLALSGGGIRSATFALGLVQALARARVLGKVDFLSTVSGGTYVGAFLGGLFTDPNARRSTGLGEESGANSLPLPTIASVSDTLTKFPESFPVRWLRRNGRYLSPTGPGGGWLVGAILLRNWVAVVLVLGVGAFTAAILGELVHFGAHTIRGLFAGQDSFSHPHLFHGIWLSPIFFVPLALLLGWAFAAGVAYWLVPVSPREEDKGDDKSHLWSRFERCLLVIALLVAAAAGCIYQHWLSRELGLPPMAWVFVAGWVVLMVLQWLMARGWLLDNDNRARHYLSHNLKGGLAAALIATVVAAGDSVGQTIYARWASGVDISVIGHAFGGIVGAVGTAVLSSHKMLATLGASTARSKPTKIPNWVISLTTLGAAAGLLLLAGSSASFLAHAFVWRKCVPEEVAFHFGGKALCLAIFPPDWRRLLIGCAVALGITYFLGRYYPFVNLSSLASFYAMRLTRAYLGASNPSREQVARRDVSSEVARSVLDGKVSPSAVQQQEQVEWARAMSRSEPIPGDQMTMDIYAPHVRGGPLHLINTTLNETVDPREQIYEADRHGIPLVLGPQSISVGIRHHARWNHKRPAGRSKGLPSKATDSDVRCAVAPGAPPNPDDDRFRVFSFHDREPVSADRLDLGEWMAISGAAVATGMGLRTRLGPSLLLGLFNLRLGHWWDSGMDPMARARRSRPRGPSAKLEALLARLFPVYAFFLYELFGRFPGTANRHWYLTDGGHFENSGCYELIRRRLQFIVCCDNGADPDYLFADVANLVRLARIDFGAEIEFFDDAALTEFLSEDVRPYIGTLEELKSTAWRDLDAQQTGRSPHAALARIRYSKKQLGWKNAPEGGILLLIKPTVCGEEPLDVRGYRTAHSRFPQETTADQFFDEAQWEAYRRLGEHVGACLFGDGSREADRDKWYPAAARGAQLYRQVAQCVFSRAGRRSQAPSGR